MKKQRYYELDLARVIPMLGMPIVHLYEEFLMHGLAASDVWGNGQILMYLCMFGPSVFMVSLGMNLVFSNHNSPSTLARRGVKTLLLFYVLNIIRYIIPGCIAIICGDLEAKFSVLRHICCSDILFFAGVAFLFFALMKKLSVTPFYIILITLVMLTLDMLIPEPQLKSEFLAIALGKFFYVNGWSCFPVLPWMVFPAVGYYIGHVIANLKTENDRHIFWKNILLGCVVGTFAVSVCMKSYGLNPLLIAASPANNYIIDLANVVLNLLAAGLSYVFYYYLHLFICKSNLMQKISMLSGGILSFYCIHWILIGWIEYMMLAKGLRNQHLISMNDIIMISIVVTVVSVLITMQIQKNKTKTHE